MCGRLCCSDGGFGCGGLAKWLAYSIATVVV